MAYVVTLMAAVYATVFWAVFGSMDSTWFLCLLSSAWVIDSTYLIKNVWELIRGGCFLPKTQVLSDAGTRVSLRVWPMDIDYWNHMNNARYARKFEWGRQHFLQRTGLGRALTTFRMNKEEQRDGSMKVVSSKRGVHFGFGSLAIRYRREVKLFTSIRVVTRLVAWDQRNLYFEQRMLTMAPGGQEFVNAHCFSKLTIARNEPHSAAQILRFCVAMEESPSVHDVADEYTAEGCADVIGAFKTFESASSTMLRVKRD